MKKEYCERSVNTMHNTSIVRIPFVFNRARKHDEAVVENLIHELGDTYFRSSIAAIFEDTGVNVDKIADLSYYFIQRTGKATPYKAYLLVASGVTLETFLEEQYANLPVEWVINLLTNTRETL